MARILFLLLLNVFAMEFSQARNSADNELALAPVFSDHMVLQRNRPIKIYGNSAGGSDVTVRFAEKMLNVKADVSGNWSATFPALQAGGAYDISVIAQNQKISIRDILIGDVWLCSGQSNMEFQLKDAHTGQEELKQEQFSENIRLLKFNNTIPWGNVTWDSTSLRKVNEYTFFEGNWKVLDAKSAANFSAVGYYFGKQISKETNVPIGLIQVASGGSPTESWIDRTLLEGNQQFAGMFSDWQHSTLVMDWCRERAAKNIANANPKEQKHPFQPGYNCQAGIRPLTGFHIAGAIWYQGESNVFNVSVHEQLFEMLVSDWRQKWGYSFPFYYVQLSSIDRPKWPEFRESQSNLLNKIPNSGMAVSYDLGDSLDVHPTRKKEVGDRLALLALRDTYQMNVVAEGPIAEKAVLKNGEIRIAFSKAKGSLSKQKSLSTKNNAPLTGFEVQTENGKRMSVSAKIAENEVVFTVPIGEQIQTVYYAYQPFTRANLCNEAGLPASTFSIPVK
jgi:sialate O-acetylesterase